MPRPPTPMRRPRGRSATQFTDTSAELHWGRCRRQRGFRRLRRAARACQSRPSSRRRRPRATAGRRGRTSRRTSRAQSPIKARPRHPCARRPSLSDLHEFPPVLVNPNDFLGRIRASTLVDLYAGLDWPRWNVELFASNIFDKRNDLSRFVNCGSCTQGGGGSRNPTDHRRSRGDEVLAIRQARRRRPLRRARSSRSR